MEILALIPSRKGSKRLPHKNIKNLNGKSLVEYAIQEAQKSKYITDIIVSTDDPVVIRIANKYGLKILNRPKELCTDTATMQDVVDNFLMWMPFDRKPDIVVLLQPTSPLRTIEHIDRCIETYMTGNFNSIVSVKEIAPFMYYPNGAVFVFKDIIFKEPIGLVCMNKEESIDIDTKLDFDICKLILNKGDL